MTKRDARLREAQEYQATYGYHVVLHGLTSTSGQPELQVSLSFPNDLSQKLVTDAVRQFATKQRSWVSLGSSLGAMVVRFRCPSDFTVRDYSDLFDEFKNFVFGVINPKHVKTHWLSPIHTHQFGSRGTFGDYALFGLFQQGRTRPELVIRASFNDWQEWSATFIRRSSHILHAFAREHGGRTVQIHLAECHNKTVNYAITIPWSRKQIASHQSLPLLHALDLLIKKELRKSNPAKTITVKVRSTVKKGV